MRWWARVVMNTSTDKQGRGDYGSWVPTPETDLTEAKFYMERIYQTCGTVVEWLQL